jgi:hypothetical protein
MSLGFRSWSSMCDFGFRGWASRMLKVIPLTIYHLIYIWLPRTPNQYRFTLKMATAILSEMLYNLQHSTRLIPENRSQTGSKTIISERGFQAWLISYNVISHSVKVPYKQQNKASSLLEPLIPGLIISREKHKAENIVTIIFCFLQEEDERYTVPFQLLVLVFSDINTVNTQTGTINFSALTKYVPPYVKLTHWTRSVSQCTTNIYEHTVHLCNRSFQIMEHLLHI